MHAHELEVMRCWPTARLRARGLGGHGVTTDLGELIAHQGLRSVVDVIRMDDADLAAIADQLGGEAVRTV